jgi:hypothetical protein
VKLVYAVKVAVKNDGTLKIGMPGEISWQWAVTVNSRNQFEINELEYKTFNYMINNLDKISSTKIFNWKPRLRLKLRLKVKTEIASIETKW